MKKLLLLTVAMMMSVFAFSFECDPVPESADGSSKADALDFNWEEGHWQDGTGTVWYRVCLSRLYEEENPTMSLSMSNPSLMDTVDVTIKATVAGQSGERSYKILPGKNKSWSANAAMLVSSHQKEVYIALQTKTKSETARIHVSAKLYDAADLDDACEKAVKFDWDNGITQNRGVFQWIEVDLKKVKEAVNQDVRISIKNESANELHFRAGQSLDCPSSGLTKRSFIIPAGATVYDTISASMIKNVKQDELYVTFDNSQKVTVKAELINRPATPIFDFASVTVDSLPVVTNQVIAAGTHYYKINVQQMNDSAKYEPEFTFLGLDEAAVIDRRMSFEQEVWTWQGNVLNLAANEEIVEVIKKNVLEGINAKYIYLLIKNDKPFKLIGRYKHVREGKACKTNIDFDWESGHVQEAKTTQWYAIDVRAAKAGVKDIKVTIENRGYAKASVKGSLAFSCPYIDLQEISRSIELGKPASATVGYATYAMMSDSVIYVGATTDQDIFIKAEMVDQATPHVRDEACLNAKPFNWKEGAKQEAKDTVWYKLDMKEVFELLDGQKVMPTVNVFNLSKTDPVKIDGVLSLECPDTLPNQERSMKIAANGVYSKQLSKDMFSNIKAEAIYLRVVADQKISFQIALTEEPEGSSCTSAVNFNWERGNDQKANENLWYRIDLRPAMKDPTNPDVKITLKNEDSKNDCSGLIWIAFDCNADQTPQEQKFTLGAGKERSTVQPHSMLETATDSVVYVRLVGNTALHVEAELVPPTLLPVEDQVSCEEIASAVALEWNTVFSQAAGKQWYILTKAKMDTLTEEATSATAYIWEKSGAANKITAEVAYHCPIVNKMMTKSLTLNAGQKFIKEIGESFAKQAAAHDTLLIRLTATAPIDFEARLIRTDDGSTDRTPVRVAIGETYTQAAGTTKYYRINTANLKADPTLHGKSLHVQTNMLAAAAKLKVKVFEDMAVKKDLLEDQGERTIGKGKGLNRNFPAYAIYGVNDKIITVEVTTDQDITISSSTTPYAEKTVPDTLIAKAKLAVPNVEYTIKPAAPGQGQWFAICVPMIDKNYQFDANARIDVTNVTGDPVTVYTTATWEDTLRHEIPLRHRTIKKEGAHGTLIDLVDKAIKRKGYNYSLASTDPEFIDSMLHEAVTKEHLNAYVYIEADKEITWKISLTRKTGHNCDKNDAGLVDFDWKHGNVNEANAETWYLVEMSKEDFPEGKDLRLHVDNWSANSNKVTAEFFRACSSLESEGLPKVSKTFEGSTDTELKGAYVTISREMVEKVGWSNYQIKCHSQEPAHIWAEFIKEQEHDTVTITDTPWYLCAGESDFDLHVTPAKQYYADETKNPLTWNDTLVGGYDSQKDKIVDTIYVCSIVITKDWTLPSIESLSAKPVIKEGEALNVAAADAALKATGDIKAALDLSNPVLKGITEIYWEYSTDCSNYKKVDATPLANEAVAIRYAVVSDCLEKDTLFSAPLIHDIYEFEKAATVCNEYEWSANGKTYYEILKNDTVDYPIAGTCFTRYLILTADSITINNPFIETLPDSALFGNRLLSLNRKKINALPGWENVLDSIYDPTKDDVKWYKMKGATPDPKNDKPHVGEGYYYNNEDGSPLVGDYYAEVNLAPAKAGDCPRKGRTRVIHCVAAAGAPALMPTLARPGQDIQVLNLDPEMNTIIRIYTTEGLLQGAYTVTGESTFTIKAARENGFYLVEIVNEGMKSTLRYIVK